MTECKISPQLFDIGEERDFRLNSKAEVFRRGVIVKYKAITKEYLIYYSVNNILAKDWIHESLIRGSPATYA